VEAGLTLEQSFDQYHRNASPGPLRDEFSKVLQQTRTGSSRKEALGSFRDRLQLTDVSLFVTSVVHAEKSGAGIAHTLKQLSATLRDKQVQRAEKTVQELPVKMLMPLLFCIMPVTFLILFGPVVLQLIK
jgi:tight adherence protein C